MATFIFICALTGCSSVPVSTMLKVSQYDERTLQTISAQEVKARISLEPGLELDMDETTLQLTLGFDEGERVFNFPLRQTSDDVYVEQGGLFSDDIEWARFVLALTAEGQTAFADMQQSFANDSPTGMGLSINVNFDDPENRDSGIMTIELQMYQQEGFFTLFDKYQWQKGKRETY